MIVANNSTTAWQLAKQAFQLVPQAIRRLAPWLILGVILTVLCYAIMAGIAIVIISGHPAGQAPQGVRWLLYIGALLGSFVQSYVMTPLFQNTWALLRGETISLREISRIAAQRVFMMFAVSILEYIILMGLQFLIGQLPPLLHMLSLPMSFAQAIAMLIIFIVTVYALVKFIFWQWSVAVENKGIMPALWRSWQLTTGRGGFILVTMILAVMIPALLLFGAIGSLIMIYKPLGVLGVLIAFFVLPALVFTTVGLLYQTIAQPADVKE